MLPATNLQRVGPGGRRPPEIGQTLAEFAIIMFVFMLIVVGIIDFSRAVYARNVVASAAREGARFAIMDPSDTTGIEQAAKRLVEGIKKDDVTVTVTQPDSLHVRVDVYYTYRPVAALIADRSGGWGGFTLHGRSLMRRE